MMCSGEHGQRGGGAHLCADPVVGSGVWLGVQSVQQPRPREEGLHQGQVQTHESHQGGRHKRHLQTK